MTTDAGPNMLLPRRFEDVTAGWLTGQLAARYPGIEVLGFEVVEVKSSHTTKVRIRWDLNDAGRAAGLPEHVCLKANWSGMSTGQITEREARFYHLIRDRLTFPVPQSYFAMWDTDGSGNGLAIMEDLALSPGRFGTSTDRMGVDAVAVGLETLAVIHGAMWGSPVLSEADWLPRSMGTDNDSEQVIQYWNYIQYNLENPAYQAVVPTWVLERPALMHHALDELSAFELALAGRVAWSTVTRIKAIASCATMASECGMTGNWCAAAAPGGT